jgi:hypothetical protein
MKTGTLVIVIVLALLGMASVSLFAINKLSVTQQGTNTVTPDQGQLPSGGVSAELYGKAASVSLAAFDDQASTTTQVATTAYVWVNGVYAGTVALTAGNRTAFTDAVVGDSLDIIAFDSTYPYGQVVEQLLVDKTSMLENLEVSKGSTSQSITYYDEDGDAVTNTTAGVTVGSTNYIFDKIRIQNTDDKSLYTTHLIGFDYADNTNITEVKVSGLTKFTGSVRRLKTVEDWFLMPQNLNDDMTRFDTGSVTVVPDGDNVASETMTTYVLDYAPFIDKNNELSFGVEDDASNPSDVGLADISQSITLN